MKGSCFENGDGKVCCQVLDYEGYLKQPNHQKCIGCQNVAIKFLLPSQLSFFFSKFKKTIVTELQLQDGSRWT